MDKKSHPEEQPICENMHMFVCVCVCVCVNLHLQMILSSFFPHGPIYLELERAGHLHQYLPHSVQTFRHLAWSSLFL